MTQVKLSPELVAKSKLRDFFVDSLERIYFAEKELIDGLQTLREKATTNRLKEIFDDHKEVTKMHVERLEKIFKIMNKKPDTAKSHAIKGLINEADSIVSVTGNNTITRDAALILAAQKAEHYEIATYGTLVQFACVLGSDDATKLLEQTLSEEKEADVKLTELAESFINDMAAEEVK